MHVLYIPGSYFALIYWIVGSAGLLLALFIGLAQHEKEVLTTDCGKDHYEYWPSISTAIGDMQPERQTWRVAYAIIFGLRVVMMTLGCSLFYQKASRGVSELWNLRRSPLQLMRSSTFLVLLLVVSDGARILGAMGWTLIASFESHTHHNLSFVHFIVYSFFAQLATTMLAKRNRSNLNIYVSQRDASRSIMMKAITMWGETVAAILVVIFYINHRSTCAPGSFSRSTVCEWFFAGFNLAFDGSMWFEYKQVGMWLTAAPNYYMEQWKGRQMGKDGEEVPASAASIPMMEDRSNNSPAPTTSVDGVTPDSPAMVVHTFTFACAPASTTMWFCDVYWCHLWFEMCIHLIQHMYFMPLIAMSLSWEIGTVVLMGAPCLLAIPQFLRWTCGEVPLPQLWLNLIAAPRGCRVVPPFYILLYFLASWTHLQMLIQKEPGTKILALSFGPFLLSLATFVRYFYPSSQAAHRHVESHAEDARRMLFSIPGGFLLCMLLRILFIGQSPLFVAPFYSGVFGIVGGLVCTLHMYRHAVYGPAAATAAAATNHAEASNVVVMGEVEHMEDPLSKHSASGAEEEDGVARSDSITAMALSYPNPPAPILGALFGLIFAFCITFYTCANYIPRLLAVEPFPANLWVALAFAAGLYHSADVLSLAHLTHRSAHDLGSVRQDGVVSMLLRRAFYGRENVLFGSMLVCCLVMLVGTRQTNFTYELPNPNYPINENTPREAVTIKNWAAQEDFSGRKQVAYLGGLGMTFFFAAMLPAAMEMIICHQRARRQAAVLLDASGRRPPHAMAPHAWTGFEYWWIASFITVGVLYALCISYPFVPLGWIVREKTRPIIFLHLTCIVLLMKAILNRIRRALRQQSNAGGSSSGNAARDQRQPHVLMVVLTLLAFVGVVVFRVALQPGDVSFPLVQNHRSHNFQAEVLYLHRKMLDLRRARNAATDLMATPEEVAFYKARYTAKMEDMERNITRAATAADINPLYGLASVAQAEDRVAIWDAAKAMTSFSGMIWTVHFGLDNYNVDSFQRMVKHIKETEAGIVGILESDSMHLTNGNRDMVEYLSYHLGFRYADYGPTALDNSYGCAIISRYPLHKIKRYIIPSPLGELSCIIHAVADVYGVYVDTYVGHFGNTQHWADGLLQSQFLGQLAVQHSGPAMWLGYLVTHPGMLEKYHRYTHPTQHGLLRDAAYEIYRKRPWVRLLDRGGYDETPPVTVTATPGEDVDFNVEYKLPIFKHLEDGMTPDVSFRRTPLHLPQRHFYFNHTNRYSTAHPRWEFADRYCQYVLYKSGADDEEGNGVRTQPDSPYQMELFDWWRVVHQEDRVDPIQSMSDTEIQVIQFQFKQRAK